MQQDDSHETWQQQQWTKGKHINETKGTETGKYWGDLNNYKNKTRSMKLKMITKKWQINMLYVLLLPLSCWCCQCRLWSPFPGMCTHTWSIKLIQIPNIPTFVAYVNNVNAWNAKTELLAASSCSNVQCF